MAFEEIDIPSTFPVPPELDLGLLIVKESDVVNIIRDFIQEGKSLQTSIELLRYFVDGRMLKKAVNTIFPSNKDPEQINTGSTQILTGHELDTWIQNPRNIVALITTYKEVYGAAPWNEGVRVADNLSKEDETLIADLGLKEHYGYEEFTEIKKNLVPYQEALDRIYVEYYDTDKLVERFTTELQSSSTQSPFLIVHGYEDSDYGYIMDGFTWGCVYTKCLVLQNAIARINAANYSQTKILEDTGKQELSNLSLLLQQKASAKNLSIDTVAYIDEIVVVKERRGRGLFTELLVTLLLTMGELTANSLDPNDPKNAGLIFFRTLGTANSPMYTAAKKLFVNSGLVEVDLVTPEDIVYLSGLFSKSALEAIILNLQGLQAMFQARTFNKDDLVKALS